MNRQKERDDWNKHWDDFDLTARHNPAQAFRREILVQWLKEQSPPAQSRLLDIGSGQGDFIACLTRMFPQIELAGVEISATGIAQSRAKAPTAQFFQRDLQSAPEVDDVLINWAGLAVCSEVLEHVDEPEKILAHAVRFLAPGAHLIVTVPGGPMSAFDRHIGHRRHFNEASLRQLILAAGLIPEKVSGAGLPFFNLYRMIVILRGKSLIQDACAEQNRQPNWPALAVMRAFSFVLKRSLNSSSMGWQMVALTRKPF